jgi:DNA replication protein DnaC
MENNSLLLTRAKALQLYGILAHWEEVERTSWIEPLISWEETERSHRSLQRRLSMAHIEPFKCLSKFDWNWPEKIDREAIEELMQLDFLKKAINVILCGPNSAGKTTIASNIAYQAVISGHTVLFTTASQMLNNLASQDGDNALRKRIKYYVDPSLIIIDEVGYLSYGNRHADLLFEVISRRYEKKSTIITTNKAFSEWGEIFTNASCVVSIIDRLVHHSEIIDIKANSYRLEEAKEEAIQKKEARSKRKTVIEETK